jgi:hypothetical protein
VEDSSSKLTAFYESIIIKMSNEMQKLLMKNCEQDRMLQESMCERQNQVNTEKVITDLKIQIQNRGDDLGWFLENMVKMKCAFYDIRLI